MSTTEKNDPALDSMAEELRDVLVARGENPEQPPTNSSPPSAAAFSEYKARGGSEYQDADAFATALVERVKSLGRGGA